MILIFGGAYQGKLDYALKRFSLSNADVYLCDDTDTNVPQGKRLIYGLDKWILALVKADTDTEKALCQFMGRNEGAIVICNDISCGVVPVDATLRRWRESTGRSLVALSHMSDEVIRLFCGIPTKVK